jgi:hypothetical protein
MFLQLNNPGNYDSTQQLATQVSILRGRLSMMRLDHPERDALLTEFTILQGQLTLAGQGVQGFPAPGFTF